jgi:hypothetical protein
MTGAEDPRELLEAFAHDAELARRPAAVGDLTEYNRAHGLNAPGSRRAL